MRTDATPTHSINSSAPPWPGVAAERSAGCDAYETAQNMPHRAPGAPTAGSLAACAVPGGTPPTPPPTPTPTFAALRQALQEDPTDLLAWSQLADAARAAGDAATEFVALGQGVALTHTDLDTSLRRQTFLPRVSNMFSRMQQSDSAWVPWRLRRVQAASRTGMLGYEVVSDCRALRAQGAEAIKAAGGSLAEVQGIEARAQHATQTYRTALQLDGLFSRPSEVWDFAAVDDYEPWIPELSYDGCMANFGRLALQSALELTTPDSKHAAPRKTGDAVLFRQTCAAARAMLPLLSRAQQGPLLVGMGRCQFAAQDLDAGARNIALARHLGCVDPSVDTTRYDPLMEALSLRVQEEQLLPDGLLSLVSGVAANAAEATHILMQVCSELNLRWEKLLGVHRAEMGTWIDGWLADAPNDAGILRIAAFYRLSSDVSPGLALQTTKRALALDNGPPLNGMYDAYKWKHSRSNALLKGFVSMFEDD